MKFRRLDDRVVVGRIEGEEKTKGGIIIIPDNAKEKPQEGEVIRRSTTRPRASVVRGDLRATNPQARHASPGPRAAARDRQRCSSTPLNPLTMASWKRMSHSSASVARALAASARFSAVCKRSSKPRTCSA
jgi:hypothetical protein